MNWLLDVDSLPGFQQKSQRHAACLRTFLRPWTNYGDIQNAFCG